MWGGDTALTGLEGWGGAVGVIPHCHTLSNEINSFVGSGHASPSAAAAITSDRPPFFLSVCPSL